jgi:hypothetical protein
MDESATCRAPPPSTPEVGAEDGSAMTDVQHSPADDTATIRFARVDPEPTPGPTPVAEREPEPPTALVRGGGLVKGALALAGALVVAHFVALAVLGSGAAIPQAIRLGGELNIATWFSSALHLANAGLLALVAATAPRRERARWILLAVAVAVVSMDEVSANHEQVGHLLHTRFGTSGFLTYAWIVPAMILVAVVAVVCGRTVLRRPGGRIVALAAAVFVAGAVGVEAVEGWWFDSTGTADDVVHVALSGIEEAMEMLGLILALTGLLRIARGTGLRLV